MTGIEHITQEREEQLNKHGFTLAKDSRLTNEELLQGALAIMRRDFNAFPENWSTAKCHHILNKNRVDQLAIAGALIAAQIDIIIEIDKQIEEITNGN